MLSEFKKTIENALGENVSHNELKEAIEETKNDCFANVILYGGTVTSTYFACKVVEYIICNKRVPPNIAV